MESTSSKSDENSSQDLNGVVSSSTSNSNLKEDLTRWIRLNVGGQHFVTTHSTLSKYPKSFLYRLCQEQPDLDSDKVLAARVLVFGRSRLKSIYDFKNSI